MNEEYTTVPTDRIEIVGYADGVYNLVIDDGGKRTRVEISQWGAKRICETFDLEFPDPKPSPPEQWG